MFKGPQLSGEPRLAPRVKPEAQSNHDIDKGSRMSQLLHEAKNTLVSPRMAPRVKPEGQENYSLDLGKVTMQFLLSKFTKIFLLITFLTFVGKRMDKTIHGYGAPRSTPRQPPRVKPEAQANADLDKGKRLERLVHEYLKQESSPRPAPRVKPGQRPVTPHHVSVSRPVLARIPHW